MKLSLFTTATDPQRRGDNFYDAINCYSDLADELVLVGSTDQLAVLDSGFKVIHNNWPYEFSWEFIGQQFQRGYEACTGDWVIHADVDMLFHENDFAAIREACNVYNDEPAFSMLKRQFILPDRFNLKSRLIVAVNKGKYGNRIRFDSGGDLCQPSLDGEYIRPGDVPDVKIPIWNYECLLKTEQQLLEDKGRFARAWFMRFGEYKLGGPDDESAYAEWLKMVTGRFQKPQEQIPLEAHPRYIQETISNLNPDQWGYSGFGKLGINNYVRSDGRQKK